MPAKSPGALENKKARRKERRKAALSAKRIKITKSDLPAYKIAARRMLGRAPEMSKAELRGMLAAAVARTAVM